MRFNKKPGLIAVPVLICVNMLYVFITAGPLSVYPDNDVKIVPLTDLSDKGKSESKIISQSEHSLTYEYTLRKGFRNPYAGIRFFKNENFDISKYDRLRISIQAAPPGKIRIFIHTEIPGYTDTEIATTFLFNIASITAASQQQERSVPFNSFNVPFWWYVLNKKNTKDPALETDYSRVSKIEIQNHQGAKTDIKNVVTISKIQFVKDPFGIVLRHVFVLVVFFGVAGLIKLRQYRKKIYSQKIKKASIPYRCLQIEKSLNVDSITLFGFLAENFREPDISVDVISNQTGIPVKKIPHLIKKNFGLNYPQYLNALRMNEAKRLLAETERTVTDIAFSIGFNSSSYFNYLFKRQEGLSPKAYRSEHRQL